MAKQTIKDIPLEIIQQWLRDSDCDVRAAAMNACNGKDIPLEIIQQGLRDSDCDVRAAAMRICEERGIEYPVSRTFDPPERVYKKCVGGVIVVAEIPSDAHVRGRPNQKCRASKAVIVDIIGDLYGEKVGFSIWDKTTTYRIGDTVEIDNYDLSHEECSTGFHFFCTQGEAERY